MGRNLTRATDFAGESYEKISRISWERHLHSPRHVSDLVSLQPSQILGAIHSTKIQTGPTGKRGPPQKEDQFFRNFSGWTEPIHWVLDRNFRKFWLNGSCPLSYRFSPKKHFLPWRKHNRTRIKDTPTLLVTFAANGKLVFSILATSI